MTESESGVLPLHYTAVLILNCMAAVKEPDCFAVRIRTLKYGVRVRCVTVTLYRCVDIELYGSGKRTSPIGKIKDFEWVPENLGVRKALPCSAKGFEP